MKVTGGGSEKKKKNKGGGFFLEKFSGGGPLSAGLICPSNCFKLNLGDPGHQATTKAEFWIWNSGKHSILGGSKISTATGVM